MNNDFKVEVTSIVGESINGNSRVILDKPVFDAIRQSNWARFNKEAPILAFSPKQEGSECYINQFNINGVIVESYSNKEDRNTYFFMNTEVAKKCVISVKTTSGLDISKFNLSTTATA